MTGNWGEGYPVDSGYFDTVIPAMAPGSIDLALLAAGRLPPRDGRTFRYAELGCGAAFTLATLAATHPGAEFCGFDFMPEHVARARRLGREARLANLSVEEADFETLAGARPAAAFDYIAIHGVWTWVSAENRAHLRSILDRWLAPGGAVYIGYNAAAGWGMAEPIRRIFRAAPRGEKDDLFGPARAAVEAWVGLSDNADVAALWKRLAAQPDRYLAHDLAAPFGTALWPSDLADELAAAKLDFVAAAEIAERFDALRFGGGALKFVRQAESEGWGETARDIAEQRTFRADLFTRGAPRLARREMIARLRAVQIAPWSALLEAEKDRVEGLGDRGIGAEIRARIDAALAAGEQELGRFADALDLPEMQAMQVALLVLARRDAAVVRPAGDPDGAAEAVRGFHAVLRQRWKDGAALPGVASPRLGAPVALSGEERAAAFGEERGTGPIAEGLARLNLL